jgi:hypothetical protein
MKMELFCQEIEIMEWPLLKAGDEKSFGYILAVGIMPNDFSNMLCNHIDPLNFYGRTCASPLIRDVWGVRYGFLD